MGHCRLLFLLVSMKFYCCYLFVSDVNDSGTSSAGDSEDSTTGITIKIINEDSDDENG